MTTSQLRRMATPLLETPLIPLNTLDDLRARSRRRRQRRRVGVGGAVIAGRSRPCNRGSSSHIDAVASGRPRLASYIATGVSVPDSVLEQVGLLAGGASGPTAPTSLQGQPPLTDHGLPAVVYVGAEFCPYCAVQRWALLVAFSRFGTFSNLGQIIGSSSTDVDTEHPELELSRVQLHEQLPGFRPGGDRDRNPSVDTQ